jgi:Spy/CpxP family protein refolding chaperone
MKGTLAGKLGMAIASVLLAGTAFAQGPGGGPGAGFGEHRPPMERALGDHGRWWNNPKVVERLKLTDDQRKAMDGILLEHREKLIDLRGALEKSELQMEPLMKEDQPNESAILAQIDKTAQARAELEKANARFLLAIRGKLTAEQWKQMQADRANMRGGWNKDGRGGRDSGPGSGPGGQGRQNWQRRGQTPPNGDGQTPPPPPAGPQGMLDDGPGPDNAPSPAEGAGAAQ